MSKIIPLTQGKVAIVDDADYEWLNQWKWCTVKRESGRCYAARMVRVGLKRKTLLMHRLILGLDFGDEREGDHINVVGTLDNRRSNLRIATKSQNMCNRGKTKENTSGFKGVSWDMNAKKWHAQIKVNGERISLGLFVNPVSAARAYDIAALELHGEFARTNFR